MASYKSKVSQKLRKGKAGTGNNPVQIILTDLNKRILGIVGHDYIQGLSNVLDSFPEGYNNNKEKNCFTIIYCTYTYAV